MWEENSGAGDEVGERAAGVGEDDFNGGVVPDDVVEDHVHGCAAGFVGVIEEGGDEDGIYGFGVGGGRGVDEDDGGAFFEFSPEGEEVGVAEVVVVVSIAGEEGNAVGVEGVEGVCEFVDGGGEGFGGVGNAGEETVFLGEGGGEGVAVQVRGVG